MSFTMREPCPKCGSEKGNLQPRNGQNCVFCAECRTFQYNAPKTETGEATRSVTTTHNGIGPKQRARVIERATGRCELCGASGILHVGHILSVDDGVTAGLSDREINSDDNLASMCEECNLGIGNLSLSPRLYVALVQRRA